MNATHWVARRLPVPISIEFSYTNRDPYAVTLIFDAEGNQPVRWVFSRELLTEGIMARAGGGDVAVWPEERADGQVSLWIEVGHVPHTAFFEVAAEPVTEWLIGSYRLVPMGQEMGCVDWDELTQVME
ncbi:SsgA family sporulation/cell division regulator [Streptomyces sp. NPDC001530]|uniref:SsgA family sporulation/cell division regulator n=1 Tax=Streptomyces sp. NPDC001530 TaxID=3364582 RepID=UPI0036C72824